MAVEGSRTVSAGKGVSVHNWWDQELSVLPQSWVWWGSPDVIGSSVAPSESSSSASVKSHAS